MINTIIFDLGGVLIDWNPRYLYQKIFKTDEEVTWFLTNVCTPEWNEQQDAGRSFAEATEEAVLNSLFVADTVVGFAGNRSLGLPHARVLDLLRRHGRGE